jgi:hypothetical protein
MLLTQAFVLPAISAMACNVPVFRYALERWPAYAYQAIVFYQGQMDAGTKALVEALQAGAEQTGANLMVLTADTTALEPSFAEIWKTQTNATMPWLVVRYPEATRIPWPALSEPLEAKVAGGLLDSPSRRQVARNILRGDSMVWLVLEGTDTNKTAAVIAVLEKESRRLEKVLRLPEMDESDPEISSEIALKIAFSTVRVSRRDPAERVFVEMLARSDSSIVGDNDPLVFPIYGRGRALGLMHPSDVNSDLIERAAAFVTGACSCEVKALNPGADLLFAADWDGGLQGRAVKDPALPPLIGMGQFAAPAPAATVSESATPAEPEQRGALARNLVVAGAVALLALVVGTAVMRAKANRQG